MLASLLFGNYRQKVLARLLLHPEQRYHVREIARLTGTSAGTLHKELARLAQAGVLTREAIGNQVLYGANRQCPIYSELAGILRKTAGLADVLKAALSPVSGSLVLALVFGSVARGEAGHDSDIDFLVPFTDRHDILDLLELEDALEELLTIPVSVVDERAIGPVIERAKAEAVPL